MKTFDLARNAQWQIRGVDPATTTPDKLAPPAPQAGDWLPAIVPGDINADLLRHGRMPDPHRDDQARAQVVEEEHQHDDDEHLARFNHQELDLT